MPDLRCRLVCIADELQLHYLNCGTLLELQQNCDCITCIAVELRLHRNVSFYISAKEIKNFHILTDVKTAHLI
jgi:hypothetical protein